MKIKQAYLRSLLSQDIGFFDNSENSAGSVVSRIEADCLLIKKGLGDEL